MAGPDQNFDAATLEAALERVVARGGAHRILLILRGEVRALGGDVRVRTAPGRTAVARCGAREGARALGLAFLADGGRLETEPDPRPGGAGWAPLGTLVEQARTWAASVQDLLRPLGGLGAMVRADPHRLAALGAVPEVARRVAALADGRRTVARILAAAEDDELLTARVLDRLHLEGVLESLDADDAQDPLLPAPRAEGSHFSMPQRGWGQTSALPETDLEEFEGQAVSTDVQHWLQDEDAPPTLLSESAFMGAYSKPEAPAAEPPAPPVAPAPRPAPSAEARTERPPTVSEAPEPVASPPAVSPAAPSPALHAVPDREPTADVDPTPSTEQVQPTAQGVSKVRQGVPYSTRRPEPADEDHDILHAAGVGGRGPWLVLGAVALGLAVLFAIVSHKSSEPPAPPDAGLALAPVATATVATSSVATATVSTATVAAQAPAPDGLRPTVAAPDAPEAVRAAEALVETERYAQAERALARLRRSRPNDPAVMILSGMVYVDTNRLSRANRMADRALALDRRSFRAWVLKGSVLQFQRKDARALKAYQRALELGPDHPMSNQLRAVVTALERRTR